MEIIDYAGCDGWAAMLRHEWHIPRFPFIHHKKLEKTPSHRGNVVASNQYIKQ